MRSHKKAIISLIGHEIQLSLKNSLQIGDLAYSIPLFR